MKIVVLDKQIRRNLALFKHLINRQAKKTKKYFRFAKKSYRAFVNRKTGELIFFELKKDKKVPSKDWTEIRIQLRPDQNVLLKYSLWKMIVPLIVPN